MYLLARENVSQIGVSGYIYAFWKGEFKASWVVPQVYIAT